MGREPRRHTGIASAVTDGFQVVSSAPIEHLVAKLDQTLLDVQYVVPSFIQQGQHRQR